MANRSSSLVKQRIHIMIGFSFKALPLTCLGTPLHKGNRKCILYDDLIDKLRKKLQYQIQSSLSHGGRLKLIKSTLCSTPLHLIEVLNPPKKILKWQLPLGSISSSKILRNVFPGIVRVSRNDSSTKIRMCKVDSELQKHIFWIISSGKISFLCDNWIGKQTLLQMVNPPRVDSERAPSGKLQLLQIRDLMLISNILPFIMA
ncbi:hypothetical protein Sango_2888900 [Sesamum angolense]|uniref:Uncharacterized protein n=1 Tax=Sesamum angolense TaxID=2727404 RepID=A0AAE1T5Z7_9LAMI|nr:hypothetical protein Sango_2888900 [Sesamum angolense]